MFRVILAVIAVTLAVSAIPTGLPDPEDVPFLLDEEEFEDYLDKWLAVEQLKWSNTTLLNSKAARSGNNTYNIIKLLRMLQLYCNKNLIFHLK